MNTNWCAYRTDGGIFEGSYDLVLGEACIARIVPFSRFGDRRFIVRSLESSLCNKLYPTSDDAIQAMLELIDPTLAKGDSDANYLQFRASSGTSQ